MVQRKPSTTILFPLSRLTLVVRLPPHTFPLSPGALLTRASGRGSCEPVAGGYQFILCRYKQATGSCCRTKSCPERRHWCASRPSASSRWSRRRCGSQRRPELARVGAKLAEISRSSAGCGQIWASLDNASANLGPSLAQFGTTLVTQIGRTRRNTLKHRQLGRSDMSGTWAAYGWHMGSTGSGRSSSSAQCGCCVGIVRLFQ